jgi:hypothetical protein
MIDIEFSVLIPNYTCRNEVPLAEQTGQIVPLGLWILRRACTEMADFNAHRERSLPVSVNLSYLQFVTESVLLDGGGGSDRNPGAAARPGPETLRYITGVSVCPTDASG